MAHTTNTTNIIFWNANSLEDKATELINVMQQHNAPIALINESKLKNKLKITGYDVYFNSRTTSRGGGTAIIIHSNIKHEELILPELERLEATAISIKINNKETILVAAYNPPKGINTEDIKKLFKTTSPIIIAGDFNAKHRAWHNISTESYGTKLLQLSLQEDFIIHAPTTFTRYPTVEENIKRRQKNLPLIRPSVIDLALTQNFPHHIELAVLEKLHSDHLPVLMQIHSKLMKTSTTRRNYNKANWQKYREEIEQFTETTPSLKTPQAIDDAVKHLTSIIQESINSNVPLVNTNKNTAHSLPENILALIKRRNKLRRVNRRIMSAGIQSTINKLREEINTKIKLHRNKTWDDKVSNLTTQDNSAWRVTRALTRQTTRIPALKVNDKYICNPEDKAELLADSLESAFTPNIPKPGVETHVADTKLQVTTHMFVPNNNNPKKYRPSQIRNMLRKLKKRKAPGYDDIPNEALINLPDSAVKYLTNIINAMLKTGYFPKDWKLAKVLMFPKPGKDHSDPNNYRPISLLCTLSKVAEKAILLRLQRYLHIKKTIIHEQFGFRSQHSTVQQVVRVVDDITEQKNKNRPTAMLLIDLQKAFDKVWHEGLISKLINLGVPNYITRILHSYLDTRSFFVYINGYKSSIRPIKAGVPQGSLLGPTLFNIYINDLPKHDNTKLAIYADDTAVYASSYSPRRAYELVQEHANSIARWCNKWLLQVNASKCETILFRSHARKHNCNFNFFFNGEAVQRVNQAKYLGVYLDHFLSWTRQVSEARSKAFQRLGQLYPLLNYDSQIQPRTALHIYKATILPIMSYASPVWSGAGDIALKSLQILQNKVARIITKLPSGTRIVKMHEDLKLTTVNEHLAAQNRRFYFKSSQHNNSLISNYCNYEYSNYDKKPRPKDACKKLEGLTFYY
jgi:Reverse transcriptase (RNA-dependent DNA polymerase)/Endonuclease-reverse transcriptase